MEIFGNLALGFSVALDPANLLYCFVGVLLGTFIGVLPGVGPVITMSVLLPMTFGLPPAGALIMLAGIYYGAAYGGSTTSILVNLPGESASVVTCIDGYQMARQGRAGPALAIAAIASFVAGTIGTIIIAFLAVPFISLALMFKSPEYFSLILMALVVTCLLARGSFLQGLAMAFVGIIIGLTGVDVNSGTERFTFGSLRLVDGIEFAVVAIGLFAFGEIMAQIEQGEKREVFTSKITGLMPGWTDMKQASGAIFRGTAVGSAFGVLPGAGMTISAFCAYLVETRVSRNPAKFGRGAIEGVAAPEAANNAAAQVAFIPTLTLGVPGSATMAVFLGALLIQGITPGPQIVLRQPDLFWGLVASMWIGNLMLVILNLPLVGLWVSLLKIPYRWLFPAIVMFSCLGVYTISSSPLDVFMAAGFGLMGYIFTKLECSPSPLILGFMLGPMLEENFRRSMMLSRGDLSIFVSSPISTVLLAVTAITVATVLMSSIRHRRKEIFDDAV